MIKRILSLALAALLIPPAAAFAGADGYWTTNEDWYCHASAYCGGAEGMVPISPEGAAEFGKYPCPVCATADAGGEIQGAREDDAGLVVIRVPDPWQEIRKRDGIGYSGDASYEGEEAYRALERYLGGEEYVRFMKDYRESGSASASVVVPTDWIGLGMPLSKRRINGAWYYVFRPEAGPAEEPVRVSVPGIGYELSMEGGTLICDCRDYAYEEFQQQTELVLAEESGDVLFEQNYGDLRVSVRRMLDMYVALVLRDRLDDADFEADTVLSIGGRSAIPVQGGAEEVGLYGCVLTEAEFSALRAGAPVEARDARPVPQYFGTPYAIAWDAERGYAIVDREGGIAVDYGRYVSIDREASDRSFRCDAENSDKEYLDGWTLELIQRWEYPE